MKRLYYCNATCDRARLDSYGLNLVKFRTFNGGIAVHVYRYPSMTSAQHLRKYAQWLAEVGESIKSSLLTACLDAGVKNKVRHLEGTVIDGEIEVEF